MDYSLKIGGILGFPNKCFAIESFFFIITKWHWYPVGFKAYLTFLYLHKITIFFTDWDIQKRFSFLVSPLDPYHVKVGFGSIYL